MIPEGEVESSSDEDNDEVTDNEADDEDGPTTLINPQEQISSVEVSAIIEEEEPDKVVMDSDAHDWANEMVRQILNSEFVYVWNIIIYITQTEYSIHRCVQIYYALCRGYPEYLTPGGDTSHVYCCSHE